MLPTVSVILPVFNSGHTCVNSIESILDQTHAVSEIIVVDDGSTDGSAEMLRRHFEGASIPLHIHSIPNRGAAGARNFGISKAKSVWVAFLDSDDSWFPQKIERQMRLVSEQPDLALVGTLTNIQGRVSMFGNRTSDGATPITVRDLLFKNHFQTSTILVDRMALLEYGGFPEGRRYAEEGDLFLKISARRRCVLLNEVLVDYAGGKPGFGASGLSANLWRMEQGELANIAAVWRRSDASFWLVCSALGFSVLKFLRRLGIRSYRSLSE